jgi:hypothetical protein
MTAIFTSRTAGSLFAALVGFPGGVGVRFPSGHFKRSQEFFLPDQVFEMVGELPLMRIYIGGELLFLVPLPIEIQVIHGIQYRLFTIGKLTDLLRDFIRQAVCFRRMENYVTV